MSTVPGLLAIFLLLLLASPAAAQKRQPAVSRIKVMARLPLEGASVRKMLPYSAKKRHFLYLLLDPGKGYRVVDVSKPERPVMVDNAVIPAPEIVQEVRTIDGDLGISGVAVSGPPIPEPGQAGTIRLLDLQDPAHPRTLLTVEKVTSDYTDSKRKLIYVANAEGLTIVKYWPAPKPMPYCTSTDAMSINPDCQ